MLKGPRLPWWWRVEPEVSSSVIQDDLDKTGHICLFGLMQSEKRMLLQQKEGKYNKEICLDQTEEYLNNDCIVIYTSAG